MQPRGSCDQAGGRGRPSRAWDQAGGILYLWSHHTTAALAASLVGIYTINSEEAIWAVEEAVSEAPL